MRATFLKDPEKRFSSYLSANIERESLNCLILILSPYSTFRCGYIVYYVGTELVYAVIQFLNVHQNIHLYTQRSAGSVMVVDGYVML